MPVLQVLRFLGVLPLQFSASGGARFSLVSWPMIYSVFAYCLLLTLMWFTYSTWIDGGFKSSGFSSTVLRILILALVSEVVFVPVTHWFEARHIAILLSDWVNFQKIYTQRTTKFLEFGLNRGRLMALLVMITMLLIIQQAVTELFASHDYLEPSTYGHIAVYCLNLQLRNFIVILWAVLCRSTKMAARTMLQHFKKDMETSTRPTDIISNYMGLWLELSRLAAYIGTAFCKVYSHLIVYLVATLTIYLYYLIFTVIEGMNGDFLWFLSEATITVVILYTICDAASDVYQQVGVCFSRYLLGLRVDSKYLKSHTEVDAFLKIVDIDAPVISLNGYVAINRALFSSVGSTLVTYLVVLAQFRLSS